MLRIVFLLFTTFCFSQSNKAYSKTYYESQVLKSEGWIENGKKNGYWYFYFENENIDSKGDYVNDLKNGYWFYYGTDGKLLKEGHYVNNQKTAWWILYVGDHTTIKIQYENNMREGYALLYKNGNLYKAEKYSKDTLTGSWTSLKSFKKQNPDAFF